MGQQIEIKGSVVLGAMLVIDTDRGLTGQNSKAFATAQEAAGTILGVQLAAEMFEVLPSAGPRC